MCSIPGRESGGSLGAESGAVAQLVERRHGMAEVARSTRVGSTSSVGYMLAGFVAGEGSFSISTTHRLHVDGSPIQKFVFSVQVEACDVGMLDTLREFIGVGSIRVAPSQRPTWEPTAVYTVNSMTAHWQATIPFADTYLLRCAKRGQFDAWRSELEAYVDRHNARCGRGRSQCMEDGCGRPVRGRGLCRVHYYRVTGW